MVKKTAKDIVREAAAKHRRKAEDNWEYYQTTGVGRYDNAYFKHDAIATALEKYLEEQQIRADASAFKNILANFAEEAAAAKCLPDAQRLEALDRLAKELVWRAKMEGVWQEVRRYE